MTFRGLPVITIEEHYWDTALDGYMSGPPASRAGMIWDRLLDLGEDRLRVMDAAGIDVQIVSLTAPSLQNVPPSVARELALRTNDGLAELIGRYPRRLSAFAALPTPDPEAAAGELERCVRDLGFKGGMVAGLTHGRFLSEGEFHPLLATAERLDVPIYIHPSWPEPEVARRWLGADGLFAPLTMQGAFGFTLETCTQALRMIVSGACDTFPGLQLILGHMGEALPFLLWRINNTFRNEHPERRTIREVLTSQFHVTTSGFFSTPALQCVIAEMGIDRVMFSVDYPFASIDGGREWLESVPLDGDDLRRFCGGNAATLLKLAPDMRPGSPCA